MIKKTKPKTPKYWNQACRELSKKDKKLAHLISKYTNLKIQSNGDPFTTLTRAIVGQQISVAAAESIWQKLYCVISDDNKKNQKIILIEPLEFLKNYYRLNSVGLSTRKRRYIYKLAQHFVDNGEFSEQLLKMNDECVDNTLISFSGIGIWTVNMFKIFCLMQPDIFPEKDLGLKNAIIKTYNIKNDDRQLENIIQLSEKWKPWRTVATWYLWCSIDPVPINY